MSSPKIAIIYYYGHAAIMTDSVKKGIEEAGGTCDIYRVEETLSEEILGMMGASPNKASHLVITADKLTEFDGFTFAISGRFGSAPAQIKDTR